MRAFKCNRCGEYGDNPATQKALKWQDIGFDIKTDEDSDLCDDCWGEFEMHITRTAET